MSADVKDSGFQCFSVSVIQHLCEKPGKMWYWIVTGANLGKVNG
jgi:hypothetical protein